MKANNENSDDNTALADGANGWRKTAQSRFDNFAQSRREQLARGRQNTALAFLISITSLNADIGLVGGRGQRPRGLDGGR